MFLNNQKIANILKFKNIHILVFINCCIFKNFKIVIVDPCVYAAWLLLDDFYCLFCNLVFRGCRTCLKLLAKGHLQPGIH